MTVGFRLLGYIALALLATLLLAVIVVRWQWQIRDAVSDIQWPVSTIAAQTGDAVTATWLGTTTILFDDGETQILIDGTFTRLSPLQVALFRPVQSDIATINYAVSTFRIDRLAAIVPVHSHFDHAMDVGHLANRTSAVILGSESTANIARGADVPVNQYQILADGETRQFGEFAIKLIASVHAPIGQNDQEYFPGVIDMPLRQPARVSAWKTGIAWSIIIGHPRGTTLVQGSGGFVEGKLDGESVDVAMLALAKLSGLGEEYVGNFWRETVVSTAASRVIAIHHDDFTLPFGEVRLFPKIVDNVVKTAGWIDEIVAGTDEVVTIELPPFGQPIILY